MKIVFELFTQPFGLPLEWYWELIILAFIGFIAFIFAYKLTGYLYNTESIEGKSIGCFFHWLIRFIAFIVIWALIYGIIFIFKLLFG